MHRSIAALALLLTATPGPAAAQADKPAADARLLAHRFVQLARGSLGGAADPSVAQLTRGAILLDQAIEIDPTLAEPWLLRAEAAEMLGQRDRLVECLKAYLKLEPTDDVAQLRLIELLAEQQQTVEKRRGFYERIAEGPAARRFTAALRSRVALRAALLAAEQGEPQQYARLLALALSLDKTNKQAAAESYRVLASNPGTALNEIAAALFTLFEADPADPAAHQLIGELLLELGRYESAVGWLNAAHGISRARFGGAEPALGHRTALALWGAGRTADARALLDAMVSPLIDRPVSEQATEQDAAERAKAIGEAVEQADPRTLLLRIALLGQTAEAQTIDQAMRWVNLNAEAMIEAGADEPAIQRGRLWAMLVAERDLTDAATLAQKLGDTPVADGWLSLRRGAAAAAIEQLQPAADNGDGRAVLGLGIAAEQQGDREQAVAHYRRAHRRAPDDVFGLIALSRLESLAAPPAAIEGGAMVADLFAKVPDALRRIGADPIRVVQLRARVEPQVYPIGRPAYLIVELHNVSSHTLSLGPDGTIPTRLLVSANLRINGQPGPQVRPDVLNLYRRLRLPPRRSLTVKVRVDGGQLGLTMDAAAFARITADLSLVLNPALGRGGTFVPGFLGVSTQVRQVTRTGTPGSAQAVDQRLSELTSPDPQVALPAGALVIPIAQSTAANDAQQAADWMKRLTRAFAQRSALGQAYLVTFADKAQAAREVTRPLLTAATEQVDPRVIIALLATQAAPQDASPVFDAVLNAALRGNHGPIAQRFAEATKQVLEQAREADEQEQASPER